MPGNSPYEAFQAFVEPLRKALACVATIKLECSPGGRTVLNTDHRLYANGDNYIPLKGKPSLELLVRMRYQIIEDIRESYGPLRIRTRGYIYSLQEAGGGAVLDYHWHRLATPMSNARTCTSARHSCALTPFSPQRSTSSPVA